MPYIGKAPNQGVRTRFIYQATAGQTSFSGSDANANVLSYSDGEYVDVYQNGVLLKPATDYTATSGTTAVLVTGASLNDVIEIIVYDAFSIANSYTKVRIRYTLSFSWKRQYNTNQRQQYHGRYNNTKWYKRIVSRTYNSYKCYNHS